MPTITFTRDTLPHESDDEHKAGDSIDCNEASAERWFKRGAATLADKAIKAPPEDKAVKDPPQDKAVESPAKSEGGKPPQQPRE